MYCVWQVVKTPTIILNNPVYYILIITMYSRVSYVRKTTVIYCLIYNCVFDVDCVWNVTAHAQKSDFVFRRNGRVHLNRRGVPVQSTTGSRGVRISGSNAGYTMFRGSVKSTGYPLHSPGSPSLPPTVRHGVPSHFNWTLQRLPIIKLPTLDYSSNSK
jgi:hypothetical protein